MSEDEKPRKVYLTGTAYGTSNDGETKPEETPTTQEEQDDE